MPEGVATKEDELPFRDRFKQGPMTKEEALLVLALEARNPTPPSEGGAVSVSAAKAIIAYELEREAEAKAGKTGGGPVVVPPWLQKAST